MEGEILSHSFRGLRTRNFFAFARGSVSPPPLLYGFLIDKFRQLAPPFLCGKFIVTPVVHLYADNFSFPLIIDQL